MKAQTIATADYLDILFQNRNKQYGSYAIRKYHDRDMVRSLLLMLLVVIAFVLSGFIPEKNASSPAVKEVQMKEHELTEIEMVVPPTPPEVPEPEPAAAKPTVENPMLVIEPDVEVTEAPVTIDSFDGRESGPTTNTGTPGVDIPVGNGSTGTGTTPATNTESSEPRDYTEQMPEFDGDIYRYLSKAVRYPRQAVQAGIEGRVIVHFVVNRDGSIVDVELVRGIGGGCDEEALRVVRGMPAWKPGMHNGKAVRVNYNLPISFRLQ